MTEHLVITETDSETGMPTGYGPRRLLRHVISHVLNAHDGCCLDSQADYSRVLTALVDALSETPHIATIGD